VFCRSRRRTRPTGGCVMTRSVEEIRRFMDAHERPPDAAEDPLAGWLTRADVQMLVEAAERAKGHVGVAEPPRDPGAALPGVIDAAVAGKALVVKVHGLQLARHLQRGGQRPEDPRREG